MSEENIIETFEGAPVKVVNVEPSTGTVHGVYQNGKTVRLDVPLDSLPVRGEIFLLGENQWQPAPNAVWLAENSIAVVKLVLDDKIVLIDDGLTLKQVRNQLGADVSIGNTIEFNDVDGLVSVISETPIRSRDHEIGNDEIIREYRIDTTGDGPSFDDFGGYPKVVERARELIETQFDNRSQLENIGARPLKGILFSGPPGTGKTHLARIIAHSTKADFFLVSGPSIISKWVGDTEDTLRKIFSAAKKSKSGKAIVFFDEIDSIAERRSGETHEASKRLVAQLLTLLDGFDDGGSSVVVIAATNRVEALDPALMRPGRFDWEIEFGSPSEEDRTEILRVGAKHHQTFGKLPLEELAMLTEGWSSAELASLWTEAALLAAGDKRVSIAAEDMVQAYERVTLRPRRAESAAVGV